MIIMKLLKYIILIIIFIMPIKVSAYEKSVIDITKMSIEDLSDAMDKGYITSELLVKLYLDRIDAYDSKFNAIREINNNAINEAKRLDEERRQGTVRSLLHGIPIVVKTNIDVKGIPTTAGAKALKDNYPNEDAEVIKKLRNAGAIILGSTNMSEFAFQASLSNSSYGNVKNAFNPLYSPNGSSGGSAVAVALSFSAASLGTDTNSSIRLPASAASLVGIRPTFGLLSNKGVIPYDIFRDTVGVMSKTVKDNALILSAINDKYNYNISKNFDLSSIKIGAINAYVDGIKNETGPHTITDGDIKNLIHQKIDLLESNGANIVYIDKLLNNYYRNIASSTMTGISFCTGFNEYIENTRGKIRSFKDLVYSNGHIYGISGYLSGCTNNWKYSLPKTNAKKKEFENHVLEVMKENDVDIIIYPTIKAKLLKLNETRSLNAPGGSLSSVIGYPSLTVPMGFIDNLPYGLEIFSTKNNEELLYNIANVFESLNNNEIITSPLAPTLYEIPEYILELKELYEFNLNNKNFKDLNNRAKTYFLNYNQNELEKNEAEALNLIKEFKENKVKNEILKSNHEISYNNILLIINLFIIILFIIIYALLINSIKRVNKKVKNIKIGGKYARRNKKSNG